MPDYRAYRIKDKHVDGVPEIITADDDHLAIEQATLLTNGHDIELWDAARFVIAIKSTEPR